MIVPHSWQVGASDSARQVLVLPNSTPTAAGGTTVEVAFTACFSSAGSLGSSISSCSPWYCSGRNFDSSQRNR